MALAEKRICEHTDATTISSADEFIVDSMANGTRNITMTNLENQILSTDTYSALTGIGDGTITGSIADIDSNLNNLTYDSTTNRLTMTGNTEFSGTIDSVPTAGSGNAVSSGGTKTYVDSAVSQLNDEIGAALDNSKITVFTQTFSNVTIDNAWGSMYESTQKQFDISSLGLQSPPKAVYLGLKQAHNAIMFELLAPLATSIPFHFIRPNQMTTAINITATALVIY